MLRNTDMRSDTRPRPPSSSEEEDNDSEKFYVKPSFPDCDEPPPSKKKKNKDAPAQENFKVKGRREEPFQASSSVSKQKRSKKRQRKSGIDLEELLARTYPKEIPKPVEHANQIPAEASSRRSTRKKKKTAKEVSDYAKKWSGDDEISIATALLECCSPEGEINIAAFYQRAKESLPGEVSNSQLYDKMRNMRKRFWAIESKLKEQKVPEDEFAYRTRQEPALFIIWKQIWGNNVNNHEIRAENPKENDAQDLRLIELGNPSKNREENSMEIENENPRGNGAENPRENRDENPMEIEGESPRQYSNETLRKKGAGSPTVNVDERENSQGTEGENPRGIEGENPTKVGSDSPRKNQVPYSRGSGVDEDQQEREGKEDEEQSPQNPASHETPNSKENRVSKLLQTKSGGFEDNFKILLENTESRLQASIESTIHRVAAASAAGANFQPFGGFGLEMGMGIFLSRKMKELTDGVNSVKAFPGLDPAETQELQHKWHTLKIQELRMFCDSLELLQNQCRLILKNAETSGSNDNHRS
ncbi:hypothetical protein SUGI_0206970 [Cryptomeria japonica]|uniref:uncharacterized protein LOC131032718 n=1 Tax=Cryptomeria japonica TaxID=3369 RepID=UPI002408D7D2|nr:uncharacterized protein LOC131032718 [Cryptomeria japonica]GLJ13178.1 hypothetical protein SUGI_0206970 [Cryptomeria japonica]